MVSVLLCFYNEKIEYLQNAINSIIHQTYNNIEFVIVSDNPNNYALNAYIRSITDKRIKFIENPTNLGLTKSLNIGLKMCRGSYVVRMDADDISLPDRIEKQVAYMDAHPEVTACGGKALAINEYDEVISKINVPTNQRIFKYYALFASPIIHPTVIIRTSQDISIQYDETFRYAQDYALWVSLLSQNYVLSNIDDVILKYRYSKNQIFIKHKTEQAECASRINIMALDSAKLHIDKANIKCWESLKFSQKVDSEYYWQFKREIAKIHQNNKTMPTKSIAFVTNKLLLNLFTNVANKSKGLLLIDYLWISSKLNIFSIKTFAIIALSKKKVES